MLITIFETAMAADYYKCRFNAKNLPGSYGSKGPTMTKIRANLGNDERFKGRVPSEHILDKWMDTAVAAREKVRLLLCCTHSVTSLIAHRLLL